MTSTRIERLGWAEVARERLHVERYPARVLAELVDAGGTINRDLLVSRIGTTDGALKVYLHRLRGSLADLGHRDAIVDGRLRGQDGASVRIRPDVAADIDREVRSR